MRAGSKPPDNSEYRNHRIGNSAEQEACNFLIQNGLKLVEANYRTKLGEIDLIMRDKNAYVFIEVRFRRHSRYGDGAESVSYYKQQKIIKTAYCFLQSHPHVNECPCRFDVVSVSEGANGTTYNWIKDAFQVE